MGVLLYIIGIFGLLAVLEVANGNVLYPNSSTSYFNTNSTNIPMTTSNHYFPSQGRDHKPTDICRCSGVSLACLRHENNNSTLNGTCPVCPTSCATPPPPECSYNVKCGNGRECEIRDDSSYRCEPESGEGEKCRYIESCFNSEECEGALMGRKVEKMCAPGLFCRAIKRYSCVAIGECASIANASKNEARCLQDTGSNNSRCSLDGNYQCSSSEATDDGEVVQTCFNITTGRAIKKVKRKSKAETYYLQEVCRRRNLASCRAGNGRMVLSGDYVEDPDNRCSYCLCRNGEIDRSMCRTNLRCIQAPKSCNIKDRTIPHGRILSIPSTCVQKRCEDGKFITMTLDADCDGKDDIDTCTDHDDTEMVCARAVSGIRARIPKCKARAIGANYTQGRYCGEYEACNCESDEICVEKTRSRDLCIATDSNGCKSKKCIPINSNITCSTDRRNRPVCSSSGVTYKSECEAFVNQDYNIKYMRACEDSVCGDTNGGEGFCGFDNITYTDLCELEMTTGDMKRDYNGSCARKDDKRRKCDRIPVECRFVTRTSDSACPIAGAQGVLHIDVNEAKDFAFSKGKSELDVQDICREALSDWEILTKFNVSDASCEVTCRPKYDTVGAVVIQVSAVQGKDCVTCGNRLRQFIGRLREDKSGDVTTASTSSPGGVNRRRRQADESGSTGSGLFISPSEVADDPTYHAGACGLIVSSLLVFTSIMLVLVL